MTGPRFDNSFSWNLLLSLVLAAVAGGASYGATATATSNTASAVVRISGSIATSPTELLNGEIASLVLADRLPTLDQHNTIRARLA